MKNLNIYYHDDVFGPPDATSIFIRRLSSELSKYFQVSLFVYSDSNVQPEATMLDFKAYRVHRPQIPLLVRAGSVPILKKIHNNLAAFHPRLYMFSRTIRQPDYVLCIDTYCGFTVGLLARMSGKKLIFRPNDSLISFGAYMVHRHSRTLGVLIMVYAILIEFTLSKLASLIPASSSKAMLAFQKYYGIGKKAAVCRIGSEFMSTNIQQKEIRRELDIPKDSVVLFFLGNGNWLPNQIAIEYICKTLAPFLSMRAPQALLMIVGSNTEKFKTLVKTNNVVIAGRVPDISPYLQCADYGIAPMTLVGGQSSKIVDYLCAGLPVIATEEAAATIEHQIGLFSTSIEQFQYVLADMLVRSRSDVSRTEIREAALRHYSWDRIGFELAERIKSLEV